MEGFLALCRPSVLCVQKVRHLVGTRNTKATDKAPRADDRHEQHQIACVQLDFIRDHSLLGNNGVLCIEQSLIFIIFDHAVRNQLLLELKAQFR